MAVTSGPQFDTMAFVAAIKAEMKRRGDRDTSYSQTRLSRQAGVHSATLSVILSGGHAPSADNLVRLLVWLGSHDMRPFITYGEVKIQDGRRA